MEPAEMDIVFHGKRDGDAVTILVYPNHDPEEAAPLNPRTDLKDYQAEKLDWCHGGRGPAQVALGILAHVIRDSDDNDGTAMRLHRDFVPFVTHLDKDEFKLTGKQVRRWVAENRGRTSG